MCRSGPFLLFFSLVSFFMYYFPPLSDGLLLFIIHTNPREPAAAARRPLRIRVSCAGQGLRETTMAEMLSLPRPCETHIHDIIYSNTTSNNT